MASRCRALSTHVRNARSGTSRAAPAAKNTTESDPIALSVRPGDREAGRKAGALPSRTALSRTMLTRGTLAGSQSAGRGTSCKPKTAASAAASRVITDKSLVSPAPLPWPAGKQYMTNASTPAAPAASPCATKPSAVAVPTPSNHASSTAQANNASAPVAGNPRKTVTGHRGLRWAKQWRARRSPQSRTPRWRAFCGPATTPVQSRNPPFR